MYASACEVCGAHTSELMRAQAESHSFTAPDGTKATVVENTPDTVTYYVPAGPHEGYYHYDKRTKAKRIEQK